MKESLINKLNDSTNNIDINSIIYLTKQDINVFNRSSKFYTDICYHFSYPIDKDIALKDRIRLHYPNISLCDDECIIKGVDLTNLEAICECEFNSIINNNFITNNILFQNQYEEIHNIISQTNIQIIKCYEDIFDIKYFKNNIGGFIIMTLIIIEIISILIFSIKSLFFIRKYIFGLSGAYILYLSNRNNSLSSDKLSLAPPKKSKKYNAKHSMKKYKKNNSNSDEKKIKYLISPLSPNNSKFSISDKLSGNNINIIDNSSIKKIIINNSNLNMKKSNNQRKKSMKKNIIDTRNFFSNNINFMVNSKDSISDNIEEYMKTEIDDMDYYTAVKKDNRKFCDYFCDKLKNNQIILNTFYIKDPLRPKTIKIILLVLNIILYLFINALFFNENYVSEIFNSKKEEKFFTFIPRSYNRFIYTPLVGGIVNYIIDCFFIEEKKIKGIFRREKNNMITLNYEIIKAIKMIKIRYALFIVSTFIISIFVQYYIFCFNNIYPHMKKEWIKSSILIIFIMQIIYCLESLLETTLRFISFKLKSEKIYKISLMLS